MKTSDAGLQFVAQEEGTVLHVYKDVAGNATVGVGHLLTPAENAAGAYSGGITKTQALEILKKDAEIAEYWVNKSVTVPMTQNQFDSLVSFTFNEGGGSLSRSGLVKLFNAGNVEGAADEFLKWCKVSMNGQLVTNQGILGRRKRERTLFLKPDAGAVPVIAPIPPVVVAPVPVPNPTPVPVVEDPKPTPDPEPVVTPAAPIVVVPEPSAVVPAWKSIVDFIMIIVRAFFGGKGGK